MEVADARCEAAHPPGSRDLRARSSRRVGSDLLGMLVLTAISLVVGCLVNVLRTRPLPWVYQSRAEAMESALNRVADTQPPVASTDAGEPTHEVRLDEFQSFVAEHKGIVLNARAASFYREAHVPGALNLPRESFADAYPALRPTLEPSKDKPIAIYCSGADCPDSQLLSDTLAKLGYRRLLIYTSGWEEWSQTGLPQEGTSPHP